MHMTTNKTVCPIDNTCKPFFLEHLLVTSNLDVAVWEGFGLYLFHIIHTLAYWPQPWFDPDFQKQCITWWWSTVLFAKSCIIFSAHVYIKYLSSVIIQPKSLACAKYHICCILLMERPDVRYGYPTFAQSQVKHFIGENSFIFFEALNKNFM